MGKTRIEKRDDIEDGNEAGWKKRKKKQGVSRKKMLSIRENEISKKKMLRNVREKEKYEAIRDEKGKKNEIKS